ncbi:MAG: tRNA (adenosine(37)-N6)-dimethylallyltransferase MiaA [SAR324 cluster bacterium]|uniref:tRNA (Adenosine(37)-N6)-dimethylallyltransferase MiaA n=1 Tax=SAR324 cluster bacterium TaxID=2024889 RepID=A0A7X9FUC6_9DELT|nr:tRNA (adenosine(37)-N6)-dimethylallyltransferase MiaA [SAR324 cluster bacterium]
MLCAGTTMYVTLLFHGLATLPSANEEIRSKLKECSLEELCKRLSEKDPETAAKIHFNDRIRIERALEIFELSGIKASELRAVHNFSGSDLKGIFLILGWPRDKLYERINIRSRLMFDNGLLEETKGIVDRYGSDLFPMKSLGYAQALKVLNGTIGIEEALSELQQETRNFAKRQYTFWRNEASKRGWKVHPETSEDGLELRSHDDFYKSHKHVNELRVCDYSFSELLQMLHAKSAKTLERNEVYYLNAQNFEAPIY